MTIPTAMSTETREVILVTTAKPRAAPIPALCNMAKAPPATGFKILCATAATEPEDKVRQRDVQALLTSRPTCHWSEYAEANEVDRPQHDHYDVNPTNSSQHDCSDHGGHLVRMIFDPLYNLLSMVPAPLQKLRCMNLNPALAPLSMILDPLQQLRSFPFGLLKLVTSFEDVNSQSFRRKVCFVDDAGELFGSQLSRDVVEVFASNWSVFANNLADTLPGVTESLRRATDDLLRNVACLLAEGTEVVRQGGRCDSRRS